jgi:hypothetical protein
MDYVGIVYTQRIYRVTHIMFSFVNKYLNRLNSLLYIKGDLQKYSRSKVLKDP